MIVNRNYSFVILISMFLLSCSGDISEIAPPHITAQGFIISEAQEGVVGDFGNLKLRIESAGRIEHLYIKERSYEVDLAQTPERDHFELFGLEKKAFLHNDITLDLQQYINKKMDQPGLYVINIEVIDKKGNATPATLNINVHLPKAESTPIETSRFQMQRHGKSAVAGSEPFGITWKTINEVSVTIRVTKAEGGASKLVKFSVNDYAQLASKEDLGTLMAQAKDSESIVFDTANNAAVDHVLGVARQGKHYMLKTEQSQTSVSYRGTTVSLNGEYKF